MRRRAAPARGARKEVLTTLAAHNSLGAEQRQRRRDGSWKWASSRDDDDSWRAVGFDACCKHVFHMFQKDVASVSCDVAKVDIDVSMSRMLILPTVMFDFSMSSMLILYVANIAFRMLRNSSSCCTQHDSMLRRGFLLQYFSSATML
jgi:hypothetical protein